jgi:hypothetical protein
MNRQIALEQARIAGYHNQKRPSAEVIEQSSISMAAYNDAYRQGERDRMNNIDCRCCDCSEYSENK